MAEETSGSTFQSTILDIAKLGAGLYFTERAYKAGIYTGEGTLPSDHPYVETGVNSNGDTLVAKQYVPGVSNGVLLAGVAGVLIVGGVIAALVFD